MSGIKDSVFFRMSSDRGEFPVGLQGQFAGTEMAGCWLIGGGPSLSELPIEQISDSPLPTMTMNLAGHGLLRPTFWTSYDPSIRFHQSLYLDASIMKFIHPRRAMDLVADTTQKVCDCPNLYFFRADAQRGFADSFSSDSTVVDWNDTLVQAIHILYHLGFRRIYLAGTEMIVHPSEAWMKAAAQYKVEYHPYMLLGDFAKACADAGLTREEQQKLGTADQYHFNERKPLASSISTDMHYFRVAQYLRLCRRSLSLAGLQLISVTPGSRLNDYFPYETVESVCEKECHRTGYPPEKSVAGFYTERAGRSHAGAGPMRDYRPHHWKQHNDPEVPVQPTRRQQLKEYLDDPPVVEIREENE